MLRISQRTWPTTASATFVTVLATTALTVVAQTSPHPSPGANVDLIAQGGADCPDGDRNCDVWDEEPGAPLPPGGGNGSGNGGDDGGCYFDNGSGSVTVADDSGEPVELLLVAQTGLVEVPCYDPTLGWYDGSGCYHGDFPPLMEIPELPEGKTDADGRYYYRTCILQVFSPMPNFVFSQTAGLSWAWFDFDDGPAVTPEQVARAWLASVTLVGVRFQLAPPETGAGLIGLPVWLGVDHSDRTWGPIDNDHCLEDVCVTIEAQVTHIDWDMGDGRSVTCARGQHVTWSRGMDFRSPGDNCHHYYQRASRDQTDRRYQITATSRWEVQWSATGGGYSGVLITERDATASLQINEVQVLTSR